MVERHQQAHAVLQATDIVDLIGEQIRLERKGRDFVGLCPFHEDRNPSMYVVPAKQIFHCFVCSMGGDAIRFVREFHKLDFGDALRFLAERAGLKLQVGTPRDAGVNGLRAAMDAAMGFFCKNLQDHAVGAEARRYIDGRSINPEIVESFQLGYAPDGWDGLVNAASAKGWNQRDLEAAGVIAARQAAGGHYDRLRHRLVFPICDRLGRPIAFGGRRLREEDDPKYLNTPESPLFDKSETLYGLHLARKAILDDGQATVVEGYTDVIACHQAGIRNVVGTLGTALTAKHVGQLRHFAERVVLLFDPDEAGRRAADRATEIFLEGGLDVAIAVLPDQLDPADLLERPDGEERWHAAMGEAVDALTYQFREVSLRLEEQSSVAGRQRVTEEYLRRVAGLGLERQDPIRRGFIYRQMADLLGMREDEIARAIRGFRPVRRRPLPDADGRPRSAAVATETPGDAGQISLDGSVAEAESAPRMFALEMAERHLIGALLRNPALIDHPLPGGRRLHEAVTPEVLVTQGARQLYHQVFPRIRDGHAIVLNELILDLSTQERHDLVDLITSIDAEMDRRCGDDEQVLLDHLCGAAARIRRFHEDRAYDQTKQTRGGGGTEAAPSPENRDAWLRSIVEQRKSSVRPASIGRAR